MKEKYNPEQRLQALKQKLHERYPDKFAAIQLDPELISEDYDTHFKAWLDHTCFIEDVHLDGLIHDLSVRYRTAPYNPPKERFVHEWDVCEEICSLPGINRELSTYTLVKGLITKVYCTIVIKPAFKKFQKEIIQDINKFFDQCCTPSMKPNKIYVL